MIDMTETSCKTRQFSRQIERHPVTTTGQDQIGIIICCSHHKKTKIILLIQGNVTNKLKVNQPIKSEKK